MPKTLKINKHKRKNKTRKNKQIIISSDFESGNIVKLDSTTNNHVHLEIRGEKYEKQQTNKYRNWFYFKAKNVNKKTTFTIHYGSNSYTVVSGKYSDIIFLMRLFIIMIFQQ